MPKTPSNATDPGGRTFMVRDGKTYVGTPSGGYEACCGPRCAARTPDCSHSPVLPRDQQLQRFPCLLPRMAGKHWANAEAVS